MRNGSIFWGLFLVLLGSLLLAQSTGIIPRGVNVWAIFWSLVLVAVGVSMLLRATGRGVTASRQNAREPLSGAAQGELHFQHGAGELRVSGGAAAEDLFSGTFGGGVTARAHRSGDTLNVELRAPVDAIPFVPLYSRGDLNWDVALNGSVPLTLHFEGGANRTYLNLRDLQVKELRLDTGASTTDIEFPAQAGSTRARIRSGVSSVTMHVPQGVAARIHAGGGLASINVDGTRFQQMSGTEYRSADYDTAANRLDLDVETGVGSVTIR
jgi:hypothetical protein